jgi:hypothetical protein
MKKNKEKENEVLRELLKIRQENYEATKNMTPKEREDYYHSGAETPRAEMAKYRKEINGENKKGGNSVLREIRKIRNKHYEETKNMSLEERMEYCHKKSKEFREELVKMNYKDGRKDFPFLFPESRAVETQ